MKSSAAIFGDYGRYYDLLYRDKDYARESTFVRSRLQKGLRSGLHVECPLESLLDLGCGAGRHALEMARQGIEVVGVDMSESMLILARQHCAPGLRDTPAADCAAISLLQNDARFVRLERTFSAVTALFHVMSYQNSEEDALAVLATAREHLRPGGLFMFDFWYGPGVLTDPPGKRVKVFEDERGRLTRRAEPVHRVNDNIVEVHYDICLEDSLSGEQARVSEVHSMRYWFLPELRYLAKTQGFQVLEEGAWLSEAPPTADTWNAYVVLQWCRHSI